MSPNKASLAEPPRGAFTPCWRRLPWGRWIGAFRNAVAMRNRCSPALTSGLALLWLGEASGLAGTNGPPVALRWGENEGLSKWNRYDARHTFWEPLSTLDQFPNLLERPTLNSLEKHILVSRLRTLSRCSFLSRSEVSEFEDGDYEAALGKWRSWWGYYGSQLADRLRKEGRPYPDAWRAVAGPSGPPCPAYPLAMPSSWSLEMSFRSGDYGIIVEEVITMHVTAETASLRRRFHRRTNAPWEAEEWRGLTIEESRSFLASLIYAIDNPWLYADDTIRDRPAGYATTLIGHIKGRPQDWSDYYPRVKWSGIRDPAGRVIINDDVWWWESTGLERRTSWGDQGCIGVVFRVIRDRFPDPTWSPERSRWKATTAGADSGGASKQSEPVSGGTNRAPTTAGSGR